MAISLMLANISSIRINEVGGGCQKISVNLLKKREIHIFSSFLHNFVFRLKM